MPASLAPLLLLSLLLQWPETGTAAPASSGLSKSLHLRAPWLSEADGTGSSSSSPPAPVSRQQHVEQLVQQVRVLLAKRPHKARGTQGKPPGRAPPPSSTPHSTSPTFVDLHKVIPAVQADHRAARSGPAEALARGLVLRSKAKVDWPTVCPDWLEEYESFHREAVAVLLKAGDASAAASGAVRKKAPVTASGSGGSGGGGGSSSSGSSVSGGRDTGAGGAGGRSGGSRSRAVAAGAGLEGKPAGMPAASPPTSRGNARQVAAAEAGSAVPLLHFTPTPSLPKIMLHECNPDTVAGCPGLGDRFRGLMETFKLAVHANRTFLLRWEADAPLEDVLQPALIDWRVQPRYNVDRIADRVRYYWHYPQPKPDEVMSGAFAAKPAALMSMTHADQDCRNVLPGPDIGCTHTVPPHLRSCVFHALFKPSETLASFVKSLRTQLFGASSRPYVAVHLRIGGFEGERKVVRGGLSFGNHSTAEVVANTLRAAQDLAAASNITAPILVLTDNDELREQVQRGRLRGFVSPSYKAHHAAMVRGVRHREAILTSFADLALLAQAECLIGSPSGFSLTAFVWGRHRCFLMINKNEDDDLCS